MFATSQQSGDRRKTGRTEHAALLAALIAMFMIAASTGASPSEESSDGSVRGVLDMDGTAQHAHEVAVREVPSLVTGRLQIDAAADAEVHLYLSDPSGQVVRQQLDPGAEDAVAYRATVPGMYRFDVTVVEGSASYVLDHSVEEAPPGPYQRVEDPATDQPSFAQAGPGQEVFTGRVDADGDRRDAHEFTVFDAPNRVSAVLEWPEVDANLNLFLKNPDGQMVAISAGHDRPEVIVFETTDNGIWRLEVKAVSGVSDYSLTVEQSEPEGPPPLPGDESFDGSVDAAGQRRAGHDFSVADAPIRITATLDWADPDANLNLFLKDPSGTLVAASAWTDKPEVISHLADQEGVWRLEVKAVSGASTYTLGVVQGDPPPPPPPPPPPSDGPWTGRVDAAGANRSAHTFEVTEAPQVLTASLDWAPVDSNLSLFLKDPGGTIIASSAWTSRPEVITRQIDVDGTYRLEVKAVSGAADYTLTAQQEPIDPGPDPTETGRDWARFHRDLQSTGVSTEDTIGASNVASLGLQWQANTGSAAYSSPAVVYEPDSGRRLAYVGNQTGTMGAYDVENGERVWWFRAGASINSSPAVHEGVVYFGSSDYKVYALSAATGELLCSFHTGGTMSSSPVVADPDGTGAVIFIGDNGLTGGDDGGAFWAINAVDPNPAVDCSVKWVFRGYGDPPGSNDVAGTWSPAGIGQDSTGRPVLVFGGSSPDNSVYAVDATDGSLRWRYHNDAELFHPDNDFGAGAVFSDPGENGFANGVAYIPGKNRHLYAFDLLTGETLWKFSIKDDAPSAGGATRATPTLHGDRVYVGFGAGMYAFDAVTGEVVWRSDLVNGYGTGEIVSSAALTGPPGNEVLFAGDFWGNIYGFSAATGQILWSYETGFIYASPAVSDGRVFLPSGNGFLYSFGLGGGIGLKPDTTLDTPSEDAIVENPDGDVILTGTFTDDIGVDRVLVAVKDKNKNNWYDASTGRWTKVFTQNTAELGQDGTWVSSFPAPYNGGVFFAQAEAVDTDGQHDPTVATVDFVVDSLGSPPETDILSPTQAQVFTFPDGDRQSFPIVVSGTATDTGGTSPGIVQVKVVIRNIEHGEHYCGSALCANGGDGESSAWAPSYTVLTATLDNPGAVTTDWEFTFPTYDHPHKYRIVAWAVDADGEVDETKATIGRICVRDPGDNACV